MKRLWKLACIAVGVVGIISSQNKSSWAYMPPQGGSAQCVVSNPGNGALALRGTVGVVVTNGVFNPYGAQDMDATLRLERSGVQEFFRLHIQTRLSGKSNEEVMCLMLNPDETTNSATNQAVTTFVQKVLTKFGLPAGTRLVITSSSIREYDSDVDNRSFDLQNVPDTDHVSGMTDITIYALLP